MAQTYEEMDAIALLKADHRKVEEIFEAFEAATGRGKKQKLAEQACLELKVHTAIEEEEMRSEGMFAQARAAGLDMDALADEMRRHKAVAMERYGAGAPAETRTLAGDDVESAKADEILAPGA